MASSRLQTLSALLLSTLLANQGNGQGPLAQSPPSLAPQAAVTPTAQRLTHGLAANVNLEASATPDPYAEVAHEVASMERLSQVVKKVSRLVKPSVVHIDAKKLEKKGGRTESFDEAGSGVIIDFDGQRWVITNRHVIAGAKPNEITLRLADGRSLQPLRVLSDKSTDIAVLQIEERSLLPARLGNSDAMEVGDFVLAVGSPFGLSHSVTFGIISAKGRRDLTLGSEAIELQDFFQTDAAINPGNSGGPLLSLRGELIGLNTAIASSSGGSEGIGFAIPINMVQLVVAQLIRYGTVQRAYLGVSLDPNFDAATALRAGLPQPGGALVKTVRTGSPALAAGIAVGDVILEFDGIAIENDDHLVTRVGLTAVGREVPLVIFRNGRSYQTTVQVTALTP